MFAQSIKLRVKGVSRDYYYFFLSWVRWAVDQCITINKTQLSDKRKNKQLACLFNY